MDETTLRIYFPRHVDTVDTTSTIHNDAIIPNSVVGSNPDLTLSQTNATGSLGQLRFLAALSPSLINDDFMSLFDLRFLLNFVGIPNEIAHPRSSNLMEGFDEDKTRIESEGTRGISEHLTCY